MSKVAKQCMFLWLAVSLVMLPTVNVWASMYSMNMNMQMTMSSVDVSDDDMAKSDMDHQQHCQAKRISCDGHCPHCAACHMVLTVLPGSFYNYSLKQFKQQNHTSQIKTLTGLPAAVDFHPPRS